MDLDQSHLVSGCPQLARYGSESISDRSESLVCERRSANMHDTKIITSLIITYI